MTVTLEAQVKDCFEIGEMGREQKLGFGDVKFKDWTYKDMIDKKGVVQCAWISG